MPTNEASSSSFALSIHEFSKETNTQATLLAGFSFAILAIVSYNPDVAPRRTLAFIICAVSTIALELLAAFVFSLVGLHAKAKDTFETSVLFQWEIIVAWLAYIFGLLSFLAALCLFAWIKVEDVAPVVMVIVLLAGAIGLAAFISIVIKGDRS
jgi:hypothetical protein